MRVAVHLGELDPHAGGGFTFASQVFSAFVKAAPTSRHQFVVFCEPSVAQALRANGNAEHFEIHPLRRRGLGEKVVGALKNYSSLFARLYPRPSRFERAAIKRQVQFVWFVGDGVTDTPDIPYAATVFDIQHRTHPWFPEVSANGVWDHRENTRNRRLRRAAYVITGTKSGGDELGRYYQIAPERLRILPHPTPLLPAYDSAATPAVKDALGARRFIFYPAQFWAHKNHVNLLHALKIVFEHDRLPIDLVLSGSDKGNLQHVKATARALGLSEHVHFLGFVRIEELVWLYKHAAAMVYPSFSGPENLPPLEAFSLGCPVANAEFPGAREQLEDAALFFDPSNPQSIAQAIRDIVTRTDLRDTLVKRGHACIARRTPQDYIEGVFSMLDEFAAIRRCWS